MEIQYKPRGGLFGDPCWLATFVKDGKTVTVRYKRMVCGVAVPRPEQPQGAAIVLGEFYKSNAPPVFTAFGARVGRWTELEQGLGELRRLFLPEIVVTDPGEEAVEDLRRVPALRWASGLVSIAVLSAEKHALGEIAKQRVNALIAERRLDLEPVRRLLDPAPEAAAQALQCVVIWLLEHPATYKAGLRIKSPGYSWTRPGGEIQRPPFRRDEE